MAEIYLYRQIADAVRRQILPCRAETGRRLPRLREMVSRWNCTIGTVQRAYQELARQVWWSAMRVKGRGWWTDCPARMKPPCAVPP